MNVTVNNKGRYVVSDDRRIYGTYHNQYMASRVFQVLNSRRPRRKHK